MSYFRERGAEFSGEQIETSPRARPTLVYGAMLRFLNYFFFFYFYKKSNLPHLPLLAFFNALHECLVV
jgi:hypothetical protein